MQLLIATKLFIVRLTNGRLGRACCNEYSFMRNDTPSGDITIYLGLKET